eukprot:comp13081_c0_seq1/m.17721 comp13081_c0_seq1/g.17721  ORF comp13081_c0_seq1/g.17721 comp13081_c0_seq1/m.17721 type:complete len:450 (-) comp13081_c0_seq1:36-1385(-)
MQMQDIDELLDFTEGAVSSLGAVSPSASASGSSSKSVALVPIDCVFVVNFDLSHGQVIEYVYPQDTQGLAGIEFKALPSGFHTIDEDYVYFRIGKKTALTCCNRTSAGAEERGARMRAVGIVMSSFGQLHRAFAFLREEVARQNAAPGLDYSRINAFYERFKTGFEGPYVSNEMLISGLIPASLSVQDEYGGAWPGTFLNFFNYFRNKVLTFWKASLLQKRVLFFSRVPIGVTCDYVHCVSQLSNRVAAIGKKDIETNNLFYVSINDYEDLASRESFLACTCDRIYYDKAHLYDIFVDTHIIHIDEKSRHELALTASDKQRTQDIQALLSRTTNSKSSSIVSSGSTASGSAAGGSSKSKKGQQLYSQMSLSHSHPEVVLRSFFTRLNTDLFTTLDTLVRSHTDNIIQIEDLRELGFTREDEPFLNELFKVHNIDLSIAERKSTGLCGCC